MVVTHHVHELAHKCVVLEHFLLEFEILDLEVLGLVLECLILGLSIVELGLCRLFSPFGLCVRLRRRTRPPLPGLTHESLLLPLGEAPAPGL